MSTDVIGDYVSMQRPLSVADFFVENLSISLSLSFSYDGDSLYTFRKDRESGRERGMKGITKLDNTKVFVWLEVYSTALPWRQCLGESTAMAWPSPHPLSQALAKVLSGFFFFAVAFTIHTCIYIKERERERVVCRR